MRRLLVLVASLVGCLAATASTAVAQAGAVFRTPGEAAYCNDYSGDLICWTPNDGFTVTMSKLGRPTKRYRKDHVGYTDNTASVLRFGKTKRLGAYSCTSRSSGLTCRKPQRSRLATRALRRLPAVLTGLVDSFQPRDESHVVCD